MRGDLLGRGFDRLQAAGVDKVGLIAKKPGEG